MEPLPVRENNTATMTFRGATLVLHSAGVISFNPHDTRIK